MALPLKLPPHAAGDLLFDFGKWPVFRPDEDLRNGRAVDFLVHHDDYHLVLECTDYDNPNASSERRKELLATAKNDVYLLAEVAPKFYGTMAQLACGGHLPERPGRIRFVLVIECSTLMNADRQVLADRLARTCRIAGPPGSRWSRVSTSYEVVNLMGWNAAFPDFPGRRNNG